MEGHFLVCENAEEEFDISFQVNSTMDSVIPKDQQELYVKTRINKLRKSILISYFPCLRLDLWQIRHRQKQQNLH